MRHADNGLAHAGFSSLFNAKSMSGIAFAAFERKRLAPRNFR